MWGKLNLQSVLRWKFDNYDEIKACMGRKDMKIKQLKILSDAIKQSWMQKVDYSAIMYTNLRAIQTV